MQSQHKLGQKKEIHKNLYINLLQRNIKNNTKDGSEAHLQWQDNFQIQKFKMVKPKIESPIRLWDLNKNCLETFTKGLRRTSQHSIYNYYFVNEV